MPVPKCSSAKRRPSVLQRARQARVSSGGAGRDVLGDLDAQALRLEAAGLQQLRRSQGSSVVIQHAVARQAHEQAAGLASRAKRAAAMSTQRSISADQVVALGCRHELRGQHFLALRSSMRTSMSNMASLAAGEARDRLLHQAEAVFRQRRLDVLDPDRVVGLHARVGVGAVRRAELVAAALRGPCAPRPGPR